MAKENKQHRRFIMVALFVLVIISSVFVGRTYAYFSAMSMTQGTVTLGTLKLNSVTDSDGVAINWSINNMLPDQEVDGTYKANIDTDINYYTRILFKVTANIQEGHVHAKNCQDEVDNDADILEITIDEGKFTKCDTKTSDGYVCYYKLSPSPDTTTEETFNISLRVYWWVGEGMCQYYSNASLEISMIVEIVQADFLEDNGVGQTFADVDEMHTLWETVSPHIAS